jgi:hypothetical protein
MTWKNIPHLVMEYSTTSHTWFVGGTNNDLLTLNILSFLVQPMFQISRVLIQYLQYFKNY